MTVLDHEKLDVYRRAIEFLALTAEVLDSLPRGHSSLRKQFEEASMSIPQNIAEGVGKPTDADRSRYYAIARGSAMECGAILDACRAQVDRAFQVGSGQSTARSNRFNADEDVSMTPVSSTCASTST